MILAKWKIKYYRRRIYVMFLNSGLILLENDSAGELMLMKQHKCWMFNSGRNIVESDHTLSRSHSYDFKPLICTI